MALNFQQVFQKIREIGSGAQVREDHLKQAREKAFNLLNNAAIDIDRLREKVERTTGIDPNLRCASPLSEPLNFHCKSEDISTDDLTLIAADGSQIFPDRHARVLFGLINVGAVIFSKQCGDAPEIVTDSQLSFDQEVENWTEDIIALTRDLAERKKLLAISKDFSLPIVTLTEGPLQLWEARGGGSDVFGYKKALDDYLSVLSQLQERGVISAGYVDKPGSNLVVRLLEVAATSEENLHDIRNQHPFAGVSDLWLFNKLLGAGERSAVFVLQSRSKEDYPGPLALQFFYLNVGQPGKAKTVRVEIPAGVSADTHSIDLLQNALKGQCTILGASPYPYILHRAHEAAVVTFEEKEQIEQLLANELRKYGIEVGDLSGKQVAKNSWNQGRKRYTR